jgi:hypothetical protein
MPVAAVAAPGPGEGRAPLIDRPARAGAVRAAIIITASGAGSPVQEGIGESLMRRDTDPSNRGCALPLSASSMRCARLDTARVQTAQTVMSTGEGAKRAPRSFSARPLTIFFAQLWKPANRLDGSGGSLPQKARDIANRFVIAPIPHVQPSSAPRNNAKLAYD